MSSNTIQLVRALLQTLVGFGLIVYGLVAKDLDPSLRSQSITIGSLLAGIEIVGTTAGKVVEKKEKQ